jgi:hypothetical protein
MPDDAPGNRGNLAFQLAFTQDHLGETLPQFTVVVNLCKSQSFYGVRGERFNDFPVRELPSAEVIKQFMHLLLCH